MPALVTFGLITYNQEAFVADALASAFAQSYSPLEILVCDDCSTDATYECIEKITAAYQGDHRIVLHRNKSNLGLAGNVNKLLDMASGEIVILAAGDDISFPGRARRSVELFAAAPLSNCVNFNTIPFSDEPPSGQSSEFSALGAIKEYELGTLTADSNFHLSGAARSLRKSVADTFGHLHDDAVTEDSTYLLRCLLLGKALHCEEPQVFHRQHGDNLYASDNKYQLNYDAIHRQYLRDIAKAQTFEKLPGEKVAELLASLNRRLSSRRVRSKVHAGGYRAGDFLRHVLFSSALRPREKFRYLKKTLGV